MVGLHAAEVSLVITWSYTAGASAGPRFPWDNRWLIDVMREQGATRPCIMSTATLPSSGVRTRLAPIPKETLGTAYPVVALVLRRARQSRGSGQVCTGAFSCMFSA